jgi:hypothetical protein
MLMALHEGSIESDHVASIDAFFSDSDSGSPGPQAVFVCERPTRGLAGLLELSIRNYAEGCAGATPYVESGRSLREAAERWAQANGHRELASDSRLENVASQLAHQATGFSEVERAVHFRKRLQ